MKSIIITISLGLLAFSPLPVHHSREGAGGVIPGDDHFIGEKYEGGTIFFLSEDKQHGLIVAPVSQMVKVKWHNGRNKLTGTGDEAGNAKGADNTTKIITVLKADDPGGTFAARVCDDYSITVAGKIYDDWYLPSKQELFFLYLNWQHVDGYEDYWYLWSSTEVDEEQAWLQAFYDGKSLNVKKSDDVNVRAIWAF